jgi:hypothetical protein
MSQGTGHGAEAAFSNVGAIPISFQARMRRIATKQGISREVVDFSDLETTDVFDFRPGDLLTPGTFELTLLADHSGDQANNYASVADISVLLNSTNPAQTLTISSLIDSSTMVTTGFISDHDGPDLETNTPMEYRLTWQSTGITTWLAPP